MRNARPAIFLGVGVVLAILAGILVFVTAQQAQAPKAPVAETTPIVVAKVDVPERSVLRAADLELREFPKTLVPTGAITAIDAAANQTTLVKIPAGQPITTSQIASGGGATGLSLTVDKGKVLVAFTVTDPLVTSGQVRQGDRLDLLVTIPAEQLKLIATGAPAATVAPAATGSPAATGAPSVPSGAFGTLAITQTAVQNLEVVSVIGGNTLIFVVDHQTSLILKNLRDSGVKVDVVIRSRAETETTSTRPVDTSTIIDTFGFRK